MMETSKFYFVGNDLSLDFVNTLVAGPDGPVDLIRSTDDLIDWATAAGAMSADDAFALRPDWAADGDEIIARATRFRCLLKAIIDGLIRDGKVDDYNLVKLNRVLYRQTGKTEVVRGSIGFEKRFRSDLSDPEQLLAVMANAAADLLCYAEVEFIKKCENDQCVLVFRDTSKNHSRRWCSMAHCGNRAKSAAFYRRKKSHTSR